MAPFFMTDLEELLLQLNVSIWDGSNEPALDLKLDGGIATIAYLCTAGKLVYPGVSLIDLSDLFLISSSSYT